MSVRNTVVLLLALSTLSLLVGCGSSGPAVVPPPSGGFTASNFSGTYVISVSGADYSTSTNFPNGGSFAVVGTLTANGTSTLTGTVDVNDPALAAALGSTVYVQTALPVSGGTYSVTSDGRGRGSITVTFDGSAVTFALDFVLNSNGHGLITRFDDGGSGSGTIDLQTVASQSSLQALAFSLTGSDASQFALASVGGFSLDSNGNVTSGTEDFNDGGSSANLTDLALGAGSSSLVLASSGTTGTAVLDTGGFGALGFDVWVIDPTHLKLIETDASANILAGDAYTQQTTISAGTLAFTLGGFDSIGDPFVAGGLLGIDVNGVISGFEDFNDSGSGTAATEPNVGGTCTLAAGRCQVALSGFSNGSLQNFQFAIYPSSGGAQMLEVDGLGLTLGAAYTQISTTFGTPQGFGLNLTGVDLSSGFEVDDIAEFSAQAVGSNGSGTLSGIVDINDGGPDFKQGLGSSTYTPDSPATGRGSISTAQFGLEYYTVDSSTAIFIETDSTQTALGTFQLQSASSDPGAAQPAISMLRQATRVHAALRRRK